MSAVCELALPLVASAAVEEREIVAPLRRHTSSCLRCQARHAAMARAAQELRGLAVSREIAPPDLEWRVMSSLEGDLAVPRSWRIPVTVAAALVSMVAAVLIWRFRPRTVA
ncbi:MAG TPA: hypothetical protein EYP73_01140 [Acidimicrobiia bacterium]|nr:hypothetical protein [Acidimicrobiia bacterium]